MPEIKERRCKACFNKFVPKRRDQKYCNDQCREDYYAQMRERGVTTHKVCPQCGSGFDTTSPHKQTYCSAECRQEHQQQRDAKSERAVTQRALDFTSRMEDVEHAILAIAANIELGDPIPTDLLDRIRDRGLPSDDDTS